VEGWCSEDRLLSGRVGVVGGGGIGERSMARGLGWGVVGGREVK